MTIHLRYLIFFILLFGGGQVYGLQGKDSLFVVTGITISGNKVSKESIILKELTFKAGDSLSKRDLNAEASRSRQNLLNTSLFNFVNIIQAETGDREIMVIISVIERWYIWPSPIFEHAERNLGAFINHTDWNRINYGGQVNWNNFRGRREKVKLKIRLGYKEQLEILYDKPNLGHEQKHGIIFALNEMRQHEVNLKSVDNKPVYLNNENSYLAEFINPYFIYTYRSTLYSRHYFSLNYTGFTYRDSATHESFTGLPFGVDHKWINGEYTYEYDIRDLKAYPLGGNYFRFRLRRRESLLKGYPGYAKSSAQLTATHHGKLAGRLYYNNALLMLLSKDVYEPRIIRNGLGYGPYLRGYELFVMDGNSYGLLVNNLKYCIMQEHTYKLGHIPWTQFNPVHFSMYMNLFFDMAYLQGKYYQGDGNDYVNSLLYTAGIGLDLVSYYDQVLRLEVSINREGRAGFFIHTEVPFKRW